MPQRTDGERLAVIEEIVTDIKERLFGNGQPGEIKQIHERLRDNGKRLTALETSRENVRWWMIGLTLGLGIAAGGTATKLIEVLLK